MINSSLSSPAFPKPAGRWAAGRPVGNGTRWARQERGSIRRSTPVVALDLNPKQPVIRTGTAQDFTALVAGTLDKRKIWSATAGTINAAGHFTAPAIGQVVTITTASGAVPTATTSTTVQATEDGLLDVSGNYTGYQPGNGTLYQLGTRVEGNLGGYPFQGTLNGRVLSGTNMDKNNGMSYFFQVTFTPDGNQFTGIFNGLTPNPTGGALATGARQPGTSLRVTPSAPTVPFPWNQSFFSWAAGTLDKRVTWSVVEVGGGSITQGGVYTAPNLAGLYTVKATSIGIPALNGTATVTVPLVVSVDPKASSIRPSSSIKLKATVTGTPNGAVTWTVTESGGGTVAADGTYTAPTTVGFYHVVAASAANPTKTATAQITVQAAAPVSVSVAPYATQLGKGGTAVFTATVQGSTNTSVTWSATTGTITAGGVYTAPMAFGTTTVTATSVADTTAFAVATVVVSAQAGQDKTFTYDANGNMTSDGARTFEWDDENRLIAVNIVATAHRSEFKYDGLGRRVEIVEKDKNAQGNLVLNSDKKYLWDQTEIAEERNPDGGTVTKRFYGQGFIDNDGTTLFYSRDHLGSIRELTDNTQTVRARYECDPYGRMTKVSGDRDSVFGYTGHFWHAASGLNLTLFRAYDPNLGRWISRDPVEEFGGINMYVYVKNNPLIYIDRLGLSDCRVNCLIGVFFGEVVPLFYSAVALFTALIAITTATLGAAAAASLEALSAGVVGGFLALGLAFIGGPTLGTAISVIFSGVGIISSIMSELISISAGLTGGLIAAFGLSAAVAAIGIGIAQIIGDVQKCLNLKCKCEG